MIETRVGPEGFIHGWIFVGHDPHVGQTVKDPKTGKVGVIAKIDGKGVHVNWADTYGTKAHGASPSHTHADLMNKHQDAKAAGKPSLASYYKKKAAASGSPVTSAKEAPKVEVPKAPELPAGAIDAKHAELLKKHADAKAGKSASLASYYKKKANDYAASKQADQGLAAANEMGFDLPKAEGLPTDFSKMEAVAGPHGSMSGQWYKDANGQKYYVKASKDAHNEVGAGKVYEAAGLTPGSDFPLTAVTPDGKVVSKEIPNLHQASSAGWKAATVADGPTKEALKKHFAAAVLTSHYDAAGMGQDNTLWSSAEAKPVLVDLGGTMGRRAQGGLKQAWNPDHSVMTEVKAISGDGAKPNPQLKALFGGLSNEDKAQALQDLHAKLMTPGALHNLRTSMADTGISKAEVDKNMAVINARVDQMPAAIQALKAPPKTVTINIAKPKPYLEPNSLQAHLDSINAKGLGSKYDELMAKSAAAKAAGKPSMASYWKKKAGESVGGASVSSSKTPKASGPDLAQYIDKLPPDQKAKYDHSMAQYEKYKAMGKSSVAKSYKTAADNLLAWQHAKDYHAAHGAADTPNDKYKGHFVPEAKAHEDAKMFVHQHKNASYPTQGYGADLNGKSYSGEHLPAGPQAAVKSFTGSGYTAVNHALRGETHMDTATKTKIKKIDEAFKPTDRNMMIYRNVHINFSDVKAGDVISDPGFNSTSTVASTFAGHGKTALIIHLPKGQAAVWAKPISRHPSEHEVLLPRGQKYVVLSAPAPNSLGTSSTYEMHVMAVPNEVLPGINTKGANPDAAFVHDLRALLALAQQIQRELSL